MVKNLPTNAGLIPGLGRSPGVRNGNPLQYSCLGNSMARGAWRATVQGATKRRAQLARMYILRSILSNKVAWGNALGELGPAGRALECCSFTLPQTTFPTTNANNFSYIQPTLQPGAVPGRDLFFCINEGQNLTYPLLGGQLARAF